MHHTKKTPTYRVRAIYDTETCNIYAEEAQDGIFISTPRAFPVLFIVNKITTNIGQYEPDLCDDISFYRTAAPLFDFIEELIKEAGEKYVPIVCAYNLMFDLQPIMHELRQRYNIVVNAQSSRNAYTVDLYDPDHDQPLLRFWDTSHLEPRGLWAMGEAAGLEKAIGDWDYTLIRTPQTPLTELELHYAARDVQVIPAYLKYIMDSNTFVNEEDLGCTLITKTSLVRLMAKRITGQLEVQCKRGPRSLETLMRIQCRNEAPKNYETYALRKACFRGGLTFTAANYASTLQTNVVSVDAVSMHHAHINGMHMFYKFNKTIPEVLNRQLYVIKNTPLEKVLEQYESPFPFAFHCQVRLTNLRPKADSIFQRAGIAPLAEAKCTNSVGTSYVDSPRNEAAEAATKSRGYKDNAIGSEEHPRVYAYSKLMTADIAELFVTEIEWWIICQCYDFDTYEAIQGECSTKAARAPEYITLLSNMLYNQKDELKQILKTYEEGQPFHLTNSTLPKHIVKQIENGSISKAYLESFYKNIIKGSYNAIYGSQAQDTYKPSFATDETGNIIVDEDTIASPDNFEGATNAGLVLYTYGMRIVGKSRMHLVIAIMLLEQAFGKRIRILGGDTDSLKISTDPDITDDMIIQALEPLHKATREAISYCQEESRQAFPKYTSTLDKLGEYEIESYSPGNTRYKYHIEFWNKCRLSVDVNDRVHITAAGISRPADKYNLEDLATDMLAKYGPEVLFHVIGYNVYYDPTISYLLQHNNPKPDEKIEMDIKDYLGNTYHVNTYQSIALEECGKTLGDTMQLTNKENLLYKHERGEYPETEQTEIYITKTKAYIVVGPPVSPILVYEVDRN